MRGARMGREFQDHFVRVPVPAVAVDSSSMRFRPLVRALTECVFQTIPREEVGDPGGWLAERRTLLQDNLGTAAAPGFEMQTPMGHAVFDAVPPTESGAEWVLCGIIDPPSEPFVSVVAQAQRPVKWEMLRQVLGALHRPDAWNDRHGSVITPSFRLRPPVPGPWEGTYCFELDRGARSDRFDIWYDLFPPPDTDLFAADLGLVDTRPAEVQLFGQSALSRTARVKADMGAAVRAICGAPLDSGRGVWIRAELVDDAGADERWKSFLASVSRSEAK